jgi:hypothetical protein
MEAASPSASRYLDEGDGDGAPVDRVGSEQAAAFESAPPLEPLAPPDLRVLRGALRTSFAFRGVIVGRVLSAAAHPKAAGLSVVAVDVGGAAAGGVAAVCEAGHGLAAGELVAFAPVGAEIPSEDLVRAQPAACTRCFRLSAWP